MKRIIAAIALCSSVPLGGCALFTPSHIANTAASAADAVGVPAPAIIANRTVLDEHALTALELAYKAERLALETAVDAGLLKGGNATTASTLDNRAYGALSAARAAYSAGNAATYSAALTQAKLAISQALAAIK